ncbi:MAG: hypothetical protein B6244_07300 [Candidatus Cloacimonetes bacterium 4572_55]|nr:MAG: hypothetical protein B6244_07300 [Candidatus Cloacimonetes bacterium 4572_55]
MYLKITSEQFNVNIFIFRYQIKLLIEGILYSLEMLLNLHFLRKSICSSIFVIQFFQCTFLREPKYDKRRKKT